MGVVDTVILFAYLALLIGIGLYARRGKPDVDDYFVAGRRMGPVTIACMWVAAWIGGASIVGTSARVHEQGVTGIWYIVGIAIGCCLFGLTVAKRVKELGDGDRHLTYPDFIEKHYDNRTRAVATITTVLAYTAYSAGQFAAAAAILQVLIGWSYGSCLLLAGAIVTLYTAAGGYLAVTYTDRVQVTLVIIGIVAVGIPVAISQAGSWADMRAVLPASHYDFGAQGWDRVAALVVSMVLSFFVAMDSFSRSFAARDAGAARRGAGGFDGAQLLRGDGQLFAQLRRARRGGGASRRAPRAGPDAADRARRRLARPRRGRALPGPGGQRQHPRDVRPRPLPGGFQGPDGHRHPVRRDVGRVHQRAHGLGELRAGHSPALPAAGPATLGDAADRHAGLARRGRVGPAPRLEDARHHRHPPVRLHAQLGRPLPADDPRHLRVPRAGFRRLLEHRRIPRHGHRLAHRGRCRRERDLLGRPAVA